MAEIKIKGDISGSTTIKAPDSGSDEVIELSTVLDGKAPLDSPTFTGTPALPDGTTLAGSALTSGKILQIVRATDSSNRSTTSTSYVDVTGMSVTITPTDSASEILIVASGILWATWTTGLDGYAYVQITDSSNNGVSGAQGSLYGIYGLNGTGTRYAYTPFTMIARATPATTSAVTYKMRQKVDTANVTSTVRNASSTGQMYAIEVAA